MSVCVLDNNDYCDRHKRVHRGRELQLALLDTDDGERYRKYWDEKMLPSFIRKVGNFVKAVAQHVVAGMPVVSDDEYSRRLSICELCDQCDKSIEQWQCRQCGCYLKETSGARPGKARWEEQKCPLKKWGEPETKKGGCGCAPPT